LNGYRKKNKLEIPTIQLSDVEAWIATINWQIDVRK
jgi:hypothetical protein